jgi:hypothetical protein
MSLFDSGNRALFREDRKKHWGSLRRRDLGFGHHPETFTLVVRRLQPFSDAEVGLSQRAEVFTMG